MKVSLVFPPQHYPFHPYLSLPTLAAYLRAKGYEVNLTDVNVELYDLLLTPQKLETSFADLIALHDRLDRKRSLSHKELQIYREWSISRFLAPYLIRNISRARAILRDPEAFFNPEKFTWSYNVIYRSLDLITARYFPTRFDLKDFQTPYSTQSSHDLIKASKDMTRNPFIDFFREFSIVEKIMADTPDVVGISVASNYTQLIPALTLARMIKERNRTVHINFGGSGLSLIANDIERCPRLFSWVDTFTVYDGEASLLELLRHIESGRQLHDVPNLIWRKNRTIIANKPYTPVPMQTLPTPDYRGLPMNKYSGPHPVLSVQITRGCYWNKCSYCQRERGLHHASHPYRTRPVEKIIGDLKTLSERYQTRHFYFISEAVRPEFLAELARAIIQSGLSISWYTWARFEKEFTIETCQLLQKAGCRKLMFGLESAHPHTLRRNRKGIDLNTVRTVLKNLKQTRIAAHLWLMVGFPGETGRQAQSSKDFVLDNLSVLDSPGFSFDFSAFMLAKNSEVERFPDKYRIIPQPDPCEDLVVSINYQTRTGIKPEQSRGIAAAFREEVFNKLTIKYPLIREDHIFSFLYADRYRTSRALLGNTPKRAVTRITGKKFSVLVPRLSPHCSYTSFTYNITKSGFEKTTPARGRVKPSKTSFVFDEHSMDFTYVAQDARQLLDLVNGKNSVAQIITEFHRLNELEPDRFKDQCFMLLQEFLTNGIIEPLPDNQPGKKR